MKKIELDEEIDMFLMDWDYKQMKEFIELMVPILELYDVAEGEDWIYDAVGEDNERNVRLIQTVYLISKFAEAFSSRLCTIKMKYHRMWYRMEKYIKQKGLANGQADT